MVSGGLHVKSALNLMTHALFSDFLHRSASTWQRTFLCHPARESSKQSLVSKTKMKSAAPSGACNKLHLKLVSPCKWPKLDVLPALPRWRSLCLIQQFLFVQSIMRCLLIVLILLPCEALCGGCSMKDLLLRDVGGAWAPASSTPLFSGNLFRNKYNFCYLWDRFTNNNSPIKAHWLTRPFLET